jgi:uncharacterized protein YwqG
VEQQSTPGLRRLVLRLLDKTRLDTHTPGITSLNKRSVRRRGRYLHNTQQTQQTATYTTHNKHNRPVPTQHTTNTTDRYLHNTPQTQQTATYTTHTKHTRPLPPQHTTNTTDRYLHNTQQTQKTNAHALSGIQVPNSINWKAEDKHLRHQVHRDRLCVSYRSKHTVALQWPDCPTHNIVNSIQHKKHGAADNVYLIVTIVLSVDVPHT